jgi:hypothetical protein
MRKYAPFFEWFDRGVKELGVVSELLNSLNREGAVLSEPRLQVPDPPDCYCVGADGSAVAVEVTEVVCKEAARLKAQGQNVMRDWRPGELRQHVAEQLRDKDAKRFHGGPYSGIAVCLFTDEPMITLDQAHRELGIGSFGPFEQLTAAYLVMSYNPATKDYPVIALNVAA